MPVLKRQFNRPIQKKMTWPDPNTINTKDDTVSNCGSWLVHKYNNDQFRSPLCVGAFFNKRSRETSEAKASLGAFPPIPIAPRNVTLNKAWRFTRACRLHFHAAIYKCFDDFNHTNGRVVTLQNGIKMNMAKALILAIYCDHPAGRKCCLCGSACPQCLTGQPDFAKPPIGGTMLLRTPSNVADKKKVLRWMTTFCFKYYLMYDLIYDLMYGLRYDLMYDWM